ncbi:SDR family NAD(P)-dependent oxidoreductase [Zunongwangia sp. HGR-M22]|uniref:SDR family NAD(P)-dependent oxidoreductase n=1 Tax=Zunongwangia sp. HGR-M22 TaxID=3015168 RepID=UPI0022DD9268|nr:SDR family oxidoreductase [Zunongwangia sp. HGR-M22]WBL27400.1 SDR family NAD(P)-dependent oxidoreductase [Zunongwangia sp. HGR-M22]
MSVDFTNKAEVNKLLEELTDIDILINNVGIFDISNFENILDDDWYKYFEINVMSSVRLSRHLFPQMLTKKWGRIIFISSESGVNVPPNMIHYGMTKAALSAVANGLSKLTKGTKVTVNTVLGGPTYSDGVAEVIEKIAGAQNIEIDDMKSSIIQQSNPHILLQRFIDPKEIANLVSYLSSPLSIATNGASLRADSGVLKPYRYYRRANFKITV